MGAEPHQSSDGRRSVPQLPSFRGTHSSVPMASSSHANKVAKTFADPSHAPVDATQKGGEVEDGHQDGYVTWKRAHVSERPELGPRGDPSAPRVESVGACWPGSCKPGKVYGEADGARAGGGRQGWVLSISCMRCMGTRPVNNTTALPSGRAGGLTTPGTRHRTVPRQGCCPPRTSAPTVGSASGSRCAPDGCRSPPRGPKDVLTRARSRTWKSLRTKEGRRFA